MNVARRPIISCARTPVSRARVEQRLNPAGFSHRWLQHSTIVSKEITQGHLKQALETLKETKLPTAPPAAQPEPQAEPQTAASEPESLPTDPQG